MVSFVTQNYQQNYAPNNYGEVHTPKYVDFGLDYAAMSRSSTRVMKFKSLINAFNNNDHNRGINVYSGDEIYIYVYSDVIDEMFKCGEYNFKSGDMLDM